ncbi:MAG: diacylglycerol kinase family lipid kinase [Blastocatellia bacterium]|nr:diacylglycerol kinase family lipid kinase [Blastocatellia bacterium]
MTTKAPLIIVNPASAAGSTGRIWPSLVVRVRNCLGPFDCTLTTKMGDATRIAYEAAKAGYRFIIACGGDGTASEVVSGIVSSGVTGVEFGLLHRGTGGDFRKTINLPTRIEDAAHAIARGKTRSIDVGQVTYINNRGLEESRYFVNVSSFGMASEVAKRANESSKHFGGTVAFAKAALTATFSYEFPEVWLQVDDQPERRCKISNVSIANGRYFGGGMQIAPKAELDDHLFDVIAAMPMSKIRTIVTLPKLYDGTHLGLPEVQTTQAKVIKARSVDPKIKVGIEVDGEVPGWLPATFRIHPSALLIRCPET